MADKQVAVQAVRMLHECPADLAGFIRHRPDVLRVHCVDVWPILIVGQLKGITVIKRTNLPALLSDAPTVGSYSLMKAKASSVVNLDDERDLAISLAKTGTKPSYTETLNHTRTPTVPFQRALLAIAE